MSQPTAYEYDLAANCMEVEGVSFASDRVKSELRHNIAVLLAGRAASPTPPPMGNRPWERLEASESLVSGDWRVHGISADGRRDFVSPFPLREREARALADAYNAHRPTPAPDLDAIATEAAKKIQNVIKDADDLSLVRIDATRIIREAIEKGRGT